MSQHPYEDDKAVMVIPNTDLSSGSGGGNYTDNGMSREEEPLSLSNENWQCAQKWPFYEYRVMWREYFAEFFGTWVFMTLGQGTSATKTFLTEKFPDSQSAAGEVLIMFGWGLAVTMGLFVCMGVSGGHINPSVTFANCLFGVMPWKKFPGYVFAQTFGAFLASMCVYLLFYNRFKDGEAALKPGETMTLKYGGIFCTYPDETNAVCAWNEFLDTTILLFCITGIFDSRMTPADTYKPVAVGLLIVTIAVSIGINSAFGMNPARDLGPRMASSLLFRSTDPFTVFHYYFWIPIVIPPIGAAFGMFLYAIFIIPVKK